jgi:hypothetical protein
VATIRLQRRMEPMFAQSCIEYFINMVLRWNKGKKVPKLSGENNDGWKGDNVGYRALLEKIRQDKNLQILELEFKFINNDI